jgi:glycogen phosphorylase
VAVGFLYTYGYFSQRISEDGWQEAENVPIDFDALPLMHLLDEMANRLKSRLTYPGARSVRASTS